MQEELLRSSEALVAEFQKANQQLETQTTEVS